METGDDRLAAGTISTGASGEQIVSKVAERDATPPCPLENTSKTSLGTEIIVGAVLPGQIDGHAFSGRWLKREDGEKNKRGAGNY